MRIVEGDGAPVHPESFQQLVVTRTLGSTNAELTDLMLVEIQSTVRVDIDGEWSDVTDPVGMPGTLHRPGSGRAFEIEKIDPNWVPGLLPVDGLHEFGDTKHRRVTYTATATSRFTECFRESANVMLVATTAITLDARGVEPGSEEPAVRASVPDG